ncbi:hypothetical protein [Gordonia westfalica]|nr:hypothetical protein [Gordonia westfalica]
MAAPENSVLTHLITVADWAEDAAVVDVRELRPGPDNAFAPVAG